MTGQWREPAKVTSTVAGWLYEYGNAVRLCVCVFLYVRVCVWVYAQVYVCICILRLILWFY